MEWTGTSPHAVAIGIVLGAIGGGEGETDGAGVGSTAGTGFQPVQGHVDGDAVGEPTDSWADDAGMDDGDWASATPDASTTRRAPAASDRSRRPPRGSAADDPEAERASIRRGCTGGR